MRRIVVALCILGVVSVSASAQERTGNIYGKVVDSDGSPLPGVSVTLTGQYTAPQAAMTTAEGNFRFLSLPVANDYAVRLELRGLHLLQLHPAQPREPERQPVHQRIRQQAAARGHDLQR